VTCGAGHGASIAEPDPVIIVAGRALGDGLKAILIVPVPVVARVVVLRAVVSLPWVARRSDRPRTRFHVRTRRCPQPASGLAMRGNQASRPAALLLKGGSELYRRRAAGAAYRECQCDLFHDLERVARAQQRG
jgi:hypothetical protein